MDELRRAGVEVVAAQADVARAEELAAVLAEMKSPLRGVVHAAGVLDDGVLAQQSWERFQTVLAPKVQGAWNLHRLTREVPLDFFVLFSSSAALLGSPGQGSYAAANAFLDALAQHRRGLGLPATSIAWGPWAGVGMAATRTESRQRWAALGVGAIAPEQGLEVLGRVLAEEPTRVGVLPIDWARFLRTFPGSVPKLLADLAPAALRGERPAGLLGRLAQVAVAERAEVLATHLQGEVARVLGLASARLPERQTGLMELGLDSLMALELRNRLQADLDQPLSATMIFDYPTIEALSHHLAEKIQGTAVVAAVPVRPMAADEPIAVVGMGCRFPGGANSPDGFWQLLRDGVDAVTRGAGRALGCRGLLRSRPGCARQDVHALGRLPGAGGPLRRGVLRHLAARGGAAWTRSSGCCWRWPGRRWSTPGQPPTGSAGSRAGVFVGICTSDYAQLLPSHGGQAVDAYCGTGNAHSVAAGRLSYLLGLQGPSVAIDTACSSSLVAVHLACQSLRSGECDLALAGGVNLILSPGGQRQLLPGPHAVAATAAARPSTPAADGYVRGEGCGVVVLKRLSDAAARRRPDSGGDPRPAVNQDGRSSG